MLIVLILLARVLQDNAVRSSSLPNPTTNGGMQNGSSVGMYVGTCTLLDDDWRRFVCSVGVLINKFSLPELRREVY